MTLTEALKQLIAAVRRLETHSECDNLASQSPAVQKLQELVSAFDGLSNTVREELAGTNHVPTIDYVLQYSELVVALTNDRESLTLATKCDLLTNNGSTITITVNSDTVTNLVCCYSIFNMFLYVFLLGCCQSAIS